MATTDRVITLQIKSDGSGFIKDVDASRAAVVKFGDAGTKTSSKARNLGKSIDKAGEQAKKSTKGLNAAAGAVKNLGSAFAAISGVAAIVGFTRALADIERLEGSLVTITGSAEGAAIAWEHLSDVAARNSIITSQAVEGFVKLKARGLDASEDALISYGNTAAAMGFNLEKMIEAVADASTFEFERLKEFGIRASNETDKIIFRFQGVETEVGKSAAEIEKHLIGIGNTQFAGALSRSLDTLPGALREVQSATEQLVEALGDAGLSFVIRNVIGLFSDFLKTLTAGVETFREVVESIFGINQELKDLGLAALNSELDRLLSLRRELSGRIEFMEKMGNDVTVAKERLGELNDRIQETNARMLSLSGEAQGAGENLGGDGGASLASGAKKATSELEKLEAKLADLVALRTLQGSEGILGGDFFTRGIIPTQEELDRFAEFVTILPKAAGSVEKLQAAMDKETAESIDDVRDSWGELIDALESTSIIFDDIDNDFGRVAASMIANAGLIATSIKGIQGGTTAGRIQGAGGLAVAAGGALGGTAGRALGGAGSGAIAGATIGSVVPAIGTAIGAVAGAIIGGLAGLFGGGGGGKPKEPRSFLAQGFDPGRGSGVSVQGVAAGAFGEVALGGRHVGDPAAFRQSAVQTVRAITAIDDTLAEMLTDVERVAARTAIGQTVTRQTGEGINVEQSARDRFGAVLGVLSEDLAEMFGDVAANMDIGEAGALAVAMGDIFTTVREGTFAIRDMTDPLEAVTFVFEELRDDSQSLAEALVQMQVGMELLRRLDLASFTQDAALLADGMIEALGGLDQAVAAVADFRARFFSETEIMQQDIDAAGENLGVAFGEIGLAMADFAGENGIEGFRAAFDSIKGELTPEDLALWIEAGNALGAFTDASDALADSLQRAADAEQARVDSIAGIVTGSAQAAARVGMTPAERQIQSLRIAMGRTIDQLHLLEAGEEALLAVRADTQAQIADIQAGIVAAAEAERQAKEDELAAREAALVEAANARIDLSAEILRTLDLGAAWARTQEGLGDAIGRTGQALRDAMTGFDGSVQGLESMRDAAGEFQAAAISMLQSVAAARQSVEATLSGSIEALLVGGLNPADQYEFFAQRAEALAAGLDEMVDPAEIAATVAEINRLTNAAFGVANPEQADQIREEFIAFLEGVGGVADTLLADIESRTLDESDALADVVAPALVSSADKMASAADSMDRVSERFLSAVTVLERINARGPAIVQVAVPVASDIQLAA